MEAILTKALCYIAIILLGYVLRTCGFFKAEDFHILSRIVMKITLPAAIVTSVSGREIRPSMLLLSLLGFGFGVLYIGIAFLMSPGPAKERRAFEILNLAGYNIGNFALPFTQSFLGPAGVLAATLFDTGNAVVCLGGSYSVAAVVRGSGRFSPVRTLKTLLRSVPFDTYLVMIALALLHLRLPEAVLSFAGVIANANPFLAMLMIGVGFQLSGNREQLHAILRVLSVRYGVAVLLALSCFFLLPLELEYRQALAIMVFSPCSTSIPAFTADLKGDFGLASAINSFSILISILCTLAVLLLTL